MKLLNHKEDQRSLLFVVICLVLLYVPLAVKIPTVLAPVWILVSSFICFCLCIVNHNHVHNSVFRNKFMNKIFGVVLTVCRGHTSAGVILAHNYNHHVHNGKDEDWIRPGLAGEGAGITRLVKFVVIAIVTMAKGRRQAKSAIIPKYLNRQKRLEQSVLLLISTILLYIDMLGFLIFVVLPWMIGVVLLIGVNLLQHDDCLPGSKLNHSRNFTSTLGNWFCFNNGFHTAHHMRPELHWTRLPEFHHHEVEPFIQPHLNQSSILRFLTTNYLTTRCKLQGEEQ